MTREILDAIAAPGQRVYVNGVVFVCHSDGQLGTAGVPSPDAPRHPNDPAWFVEILYGAVAPVEVLAEAQQGDDVLIHLAGITDLAVADHSSPYGVLPRVASRGPERKRLPFHVWLNPEGLAVRIGIERKGSLFSTSRFWAGTEFGQWGIEVQEIWTSAVSHLASVLDR